MERWLFDLIPTHRSPPFLMERDAYQTIYPYVFLLCPVRGRCIPRDVCVCYNITLEEHNTQQRQQQQQQWMRRTGYSNKIYFSCQNLTTCRLYCIQISGSHVRLAVRVCARSIVYNRTTNLLALSWKSSQPNRPFFSLSLSLSLSSCPIFIRTRLSIAAFLSCPT